MYAQLVNMFFLIVFVQTCARHIKQKMNRKIPFHLDTTEGFKKDMDMALKELKEFYTEIDIRSKIKHTEKLLKNRAKNERARIRKICKLISELQDAKKSTFTLKPTKYKIVTEEIQKLRKIRQFLEKVRYDLMRYFHSHGFDISSIDYAISAIQDYMKRLENYVIFLRDCPERAGVPPKWSMEALIGVKEVFAVIGKIGNRKEENNKPQYVSVRQLVLCNVTLDEDCFSLFYVC
eukprot:jgi/Antlo1/734/371